MWLHGPRKGRLPLSPDFHAHNQDSPEQMESTKLYGEVAPGIEPTHHLPDAQSESGSIVAQPVEASLFSTTITALTMAVIQPFGRLVRFVNEAGGTYCGDVPVDSLDTLVGSSVEVYGGELPWDHGFQKTGGKETIREVSVEDQVWWNPSKTKTSRFWHPCRRSRHSLVSA